MSSLLNSNNAPQPPSYIKRGAIIFSLLALVACASKVALSPAQRRAIQMRSFEGSSYENIFRAFKTVLQDEGYIIKNQDMSGGLIVATIQKTDSSSAFFATFGGSPNYRTGEGFEISINLEEIRPKMIETRMVIQKTEQYSLGGQQGHEILDEGLYKGFYDRVRVEVERRKAQGK